MTILDYYVSKQTDLLWVQNFQSTGKGKRGKLFSCLSVNFRNLISFFNQLEAFKDKDGLKREDWNSFQDNGQEADKHRVVNLRNAGLITIIDDRYFVTEKGKEVLRISEDDNLSEREKWILLLMLILDYHTKERKHDLIRSVLELDYALKNQGLNTTDFLSILKRSLHIEEKERLFSSDVFWLMTFAHDDKFVSLYLSSTQEEKQSLFDYVISCSKNKKSKDLVAHKFVSGGAYSVSTFKDDINMVFSAVILLSLHDSNWDNYVNIISKCYANCDSVKIQTFMNANKVIYEKAYTNSFGDINKMLSKGGH